jgi:hypothetical protein
MLFGRPLRLDFRIVLDDRRSADIALLDNVLDSLVMSSRQTIVGFEIRSDSTLVRLFSVPCADSLRFVLAAVTFSNLFTKAPGSLSPGDESGGISSAVPGISLRLSLVSLLVGRSVFVVDALLFGVEGNRWPRSLRLSLEEGETWAWKPSCTHEKGTIELESCNPGIKVDETAGS